MASPRAMGTALTTLAWTLGEALGGGAVAAGEEEGQGLARAGFGDPDHIPTTHNSGYGLGLIMLLSLGAGVTAFNTWIGVGLS